MTGPGPEALRQERGGKMARKARTRKAKLGIAVVILIVAVPVLGFPVLKLTERPAFCGSCHNMPPYYDSWKASSHSEVGCMECHAGDRLVDHLKAKADAMKELVSFLTKSYPPKLDAEVPDKVCLKEGCHVKEELPDGIVLEEKAVFSHSPHLEETVRIGRLQCTTCHSQVSSDEHIALQTTPCFTCHFYGRDNEERAGQCLVCHPAPPEKVTHGGVSFDHGEYAKSEAGCTACHGSVVHGEGLVGRERCMSCHSHPEDLEKMSDPELMHRLHVSEEKHAECFQCHSLMEHGVAGGEEAVFPSCAECHGDSHTVPEKMYAGTGAQDVSGKPSAMRSAMVTCRGCHRAERTAVAGECTSSVRAADPAACIACHGEGFGQEMIEGWQEMTRESLEAVEALLGQAVALAGDGGLDASAPEACRRALRNVEFVRQDGSMGVHNLEYADAVLEKAREDAGACLKQLRAAGE